MIKLIDKRGEKWERRKREAGRVSSLVGTLTLVDVSATQYIGALTQH